MAATIQRGTTFTTAQTNINVATFVPLLTSATITDVDRENAKSDEVTLATQAATNPTAPYSGEVRQGARHNDLQSYLNGLWNTAQTGKRIYALDINSGAVTAGDFLMPSITVFPSTPAPGTLYKASAAQKYSWVAVAAENCAPGATSMAIYHGPCFTRCSGSVAAGEAVIPSSTDALIQTAGAAGSGFGPQVRGFALNADNGAGGVWIHKCR